MMFLIAGLILIRFLARLGREAGRKVFLILDNLRVHHSKGVQAWLEAHEEQIEVFFLPSYPRNGRSLTEVHDEHEDS